MLYLCGMIESALINYMEQELRHTPTEFHRYMWEKILWQERLVGLLGPRGVGKSTIVKQHILSHPTRQDWLYVSADHTYFLTHSLTSLAEEFVREGGKHFVIDEVHKYPGWSRELKEIYDGLPDLKVIFTGSSVLDITKGIADLSRRALIFEMQGLSFREFLKMFHDIDLPVLTPDDIISHSLDLPADIHPLPLFREYLQRGYYPYGKENGYMIRLQQVMAQTMESDIPQFASMNASTGLKLRKMMAVIAGLAPYKPNFSNLAVELKISKNDVPEYMYYLEKAGMIGQLRDETGGLRGLGKVEKVYIDNTNLMYALANGIPKIGNVRETFFFNQTRTVTDVKSSKVSDFCIGDYTFEVGGKSKGRDQIKSVNNGIVVKDDIEFGGFSTVPLWQFGLLY